MLFHLNFLSPKKDRIFPYNLEFHFFHNLTTDVNTPLKLIVDSTVFSIEKPFFKNIKS